MTWAILGALLIGISLGLFGSGGSVLTVPVLTYLVGQEEKVAIASSLAIVGGISLVACLPYALQRMIDFRSVLYFGVPGMAGAYGGAFLSQFVSGTLQLAVFAALMLVAAFLMLRPVVVLDAEREPHAAYKIVAEGLFVGALTGFVGVGGGFLIVPALVLLGGLGMQLAVGTSLLIIAFKSFAGFYKYLDVLDAIGLELDWKIIITFTLIGAAGSLLGKAVNTRLPQIALRRGFAGLLFVICGLIVYQTVPALVSG